MKTINDLIQDLSDNKDLLKGKNLFINGVVYSTLKEFGNEILRLKSKTISHIELCLSHGEERDAWSVDSVTDSVVGFRSLFLIIKKPVVFSEISEEETKVFMQQYYAKNGTSTEY